MSNTGSQGLKVALLGAGGGIGQPLALLLKQSASITELALYDIAPIVVGVASDISHVDTPSVVTGYTKDNDGLKLTLTGAHIVVIPAGIPRKPGMTRDDLFNINAGIVRDIAVAIAEFCPTAFVCVISNPVNSTVPVCAEVFKAAGCFDPKRLFGVTTLDVVRSSTMSAQAIGLPNSANLYTIPVCGGHAGVTILPLLSQSIPALPASLFADQTKLDALVKRIQFGGDEVVAAKAGAGSATLSMAYAGYKFVARLISAAFDGKAGVVEPSFVYIKGDTIGGAALKAEIGQDMDFFSARIELGPNGISKILPIGAISTYESNMLQAALPELSASIIKGTEFITSAAKL